MAKPVTAGDAIHDFLASTQVFASAVSEIVERRLLREVAGGTLTTAQFRVLKMVALTDAQTISDVAIFLGVSNAAASKAVDRLVRSKLLLRTEGHPDRREIRLSLTDVSRRLLAAYDALRRQRVARVFRQIHPRRLKDTAELLDRLSAALVDRTAGPEEVCLQCGIYFRDRCLVRQLAKRNCFYVRSRAGRKAARSAGSQARAAQNEQGAPGHVPGSTRKGSRDRGTQRQPHGARAVRRNRAPGLP